MRKFPQFLKIMPNFHGLNFTDIGAIMVILYLAMIFNLNQILSLVICALTVAIIKILKKNFDLTGWLLPRKKELFLTDIKRGES